MVIQFFSFGLIEGLIVGFRLLHGEYGERRNSAECHYSKALHLFTVVQ